jgi:hypothetical protein
LQGLKHGGLPIPDIFNAGSHHTSK